MSTISLRSSITDLGDSGSEVLVIRTEKTVSFLVIEELVEQPGIFRAVSVEVKRLKLLLLDVPVFKVKGNRTAIPCCSGARSTDKATRGVFEQRFHPFDCLSVGLGVSMCIIFDPCHFGLWESLSPTACALLRYCRPGHQWLCSG